MTRIFAISLILNLILASIASNMSCARHIYKTENKVSILYPTPPDTARFQFLIGFANSTDFEGKDSKFRSFIAGEKEPLPIIKPYGIAVYQGKIFISDPGISGLQILNLDNESFEYFLPIGRGSLKFPTNCFVDQHGTLYVADIERKQVVVFNKDLEYIGAIGGEENFKPTDIAVIGDTILVTDPNNNRINAYDRSGYELLFTYPKAAKVGDDEWLYNPLNLCTADGKIYITDFGHSRVKILTKKGEYISSVGSYGRNQGQFIRPKGIAVDQEGNLFVVDAGFQNVQIFNSNRQLLMYFGGPYQGPGDMYLPADISITYDHLEYFSKYVDPSYNLEYLIFVTNQYGPDKVSVYGRIIPNN